MSGSTESELIETFPRTLNSDEERVIKKLLTDDVMRQEEYLDQLPFTQVVGRWIAGLPSIDLEVKPGIDLEVKPGALPVSNSGQLLRTMGSVVNDQDEVTGVILIWLESGFLAGLEYAWHTDEPPKVWPKDEQILVSIRKAAGVED